MKATVAANIAQLGRYAVKTTPANANGYRARVRDQCLSWAMGKPYHNRIDDECCPDFVLCAGYVRKGRGQTLGISSGP